MKALLIAVVVLVLLFVAGWWSFSMFDGRASINVETDDIRQDTSEMIEGGRQAVERIDEKVDVEVRE